jgi:hypothetical protein
VGDPAILQITPGICPTCKEGVQVMFYLSDDNNERCWVNIQGNFLSYGHDKVVNFHQHPHQRKSGLFGRGGKDDLES